MKQEVNTDNILEKIKVSVLYILLLATIKHKFRQHMASVLIFICTIQFNVEGNNKTVIAILKK